MSETIGESRYWNALWEQYHVAPSIAFCRVPELEYAARLELKGRVLDHCCGDGRFAALAWPGQTMDAGCDIDPGSIEQARQRGIYKRVDVADVSVRLPYDDAAFDLVFDNSAIEHVKAVDSALAEVARVLAPGGTFAFNVLNHRYFEWWPLGESAKQSYRDWQPFYHAFSMDEWSKRLERVGLKVTSVEGYFDREAAQALATLDCEFSGYYIRKRPSRLVWTYQKLPFVVKNYWHNRLANLDWKTGADEGAGYFIKAERING
ncbi:MAG: class I SAM-dependent methyltransferase [bacterium]|nr:class I SAM-dependent methyltransferase [bacterium]